MSIIISGIATRNQMVEECKKDVEELKNKGIIPHLVILQIGNNEASNAYIRNKIRLSEKMNTKTTLQKYEESITEEELINVIQSLNNDKSVNGMILQLPIPKHIDEEKILKLISPQKDVDCFHIDNVGKLWTARKNNIVIQPCTPRGVIEMIKRNNIDLNGKNVVIIGRSNIVGKPLAALFLLENSTVTVCHSRTKDLANICSKAEILVSAIGKAKFVTKEFTNENQVVIDVGMNVDENGKLCGDVDFENVKDHVYAISPVPGGVGPMTVMILLKNLISVTKEQNNL